jgi:hypothetical protein
MILFLILSPKQRKFNYRHFRFLPNSIDITIPTTYYPWIINHMIKPIDIFIIFKLTLRYQSGWYNPLFLAIISTDIVYYLLLCWYKILLWKMVSCVVGKFFLYCHYWYFLYIGIARNWCSWRLILIFHREILFTKYL